MDFYSARANISREKVFLQNWNQAFIFVVNIFFISMEREEKFWGEKKRQELSL